jgi:protein-tyrosine phosphatase
MKIINNTIYNLLCLARNKQSLQFFNNIANIDNYNIIIPKLYLGNIEYANNIDFLKKNNIEAIINCTENEPFNEYFNDKYKYRISVNDSKDEDNINKFKKDIINAIIFINDNIENNRNIYIHCYWGLMRSATVVAGYLIYKYNLSIKDAINIVKEQRPMALISFYNFNDVLKYIETEKNNINKPKY